MTRMQRLAALVAFVGLAVGAAAAALVPRTTGATVREQPFAKLPGAVKTAPARARERGQRQPGGVTLRITRGTLREEIRRADPAGGAPWVLRSFVADRLTSAPGKAGTMRVIGTSPCFQLGREVAGAFGWIDGSNTFRPVQTASNRGTPTRCVSPTLLRRHEIELELTTLVGHPATNDRSILGSVVWGTTGGPVPGLTLNAATKTSMPTPSRRGGFLEFYGPSRSPADVKATAEYADGKTVSTTLMPQHLEMRGRRDIFPTVDAGTRRIIARAADPGGGPSVGLSGVQSDKGVWCIGDTGSIVGDRVGEIDPVGGLLWELDATALTNACPTDPDDRFPPNQVVSLGGSGGSATDQATLDPARNALRLQPGRALLYGLARSDVKLLTITTSRDVRSIAPSAPAHAFIVSYDGDFGSGGVTVVATLKDGSTRTMRQNFGW